MLVLGLKKQLSTDGTSVLHVNPRLEAVGVENMLLVAVELDHGIACNVLLFVPLVKVHQTN